MTEPILLAIGMPGGGELLLIFLIVLIVFGSNRIPQLGDSLGKGIKNFRKSFTKDEIEIEPVEREVREVHAEPPPPRVSVQSSEIRVEDAVVETPSSRSTDKP